MLPPRAAVAALFATAVMFVPSVVSQTPITPTPPLAGPATPSSPGGANNPGWTTSSSTVDPARKRAISYPARLANLSIRAVAGGTAGPLVAGAVIDGVGSLPMLVRAVGPGLRQFGVANNLRDPSLELFRSTTSVAKSTAFTADVNVASSYVGAFPLVADSNTASDVALLGRAAPGTFTAHCSSASDTAGVALLEFYDATPDPNAASARFTNLSSRARVEAGEGLIVIGFVIEGEGGLRLLLRGVGPTLAQFNVADVLTDPAIELYSGNTRLAVNDDWRSSGAEAAAALQDAGRGAGAFDLASDRDAALLVTLCAGAYTLLVHGAAGQSGTALAEIYEAAASTGGYDAGRAINSAGMDLYRLVAATAAGQNLAVSPYSIEHALAMAYAGAAGDTRAEMARVLRFPSDNATLQAAFADLRTSLEKIAADSVTLAQARTTATERVDPIEWNAANRIFGQQNYAFRDSFLTLMNDGFAAPLQLVDFKNATEAARLTINDWVANQTRQKILDLIPPGGVTKNTGMALVNALYLKASWDVRFKESDTTPQPFHPTPTTTHNVPTMTERTSLGHATEDGMTIVTLDYLGKGLQFVIVLPDEGSSPEAAAARITPEHFARWAKLGDTARRDVILFLPKFKIQGATVDLSDVLQSLGMTTAFDIPRGTANFDGIAPHRPDEYLYISKVFHKTYVTVDESGTEAASATGVVIGVTTAVVGLPTVVRVDRPFLFAIQHRASGACLFIGRVTDPQ